MDGCTFGCVLCEPKSVFGTRPGLGDHLKAAHRVDLSVYAKLTDPIVSEVMFECLLCDDKTSDPDDAPSQPAAVRKEAAAVIDHLTNRHGTTPDLYRAITANIN